MRALVGLWFVTMIGLIAVFLDSFGSQGGTYPATRLPESRWLTAADGDPRFPAGGEGVEREGLMGSLAHRFAPRQND